MHDYYYFLIFKLVYSTNIIKTERRYVELLIQINKQYNHHHIISIILVLSDLVFIQFDWICNTEEEYPTIHAKYKSDVFLSLIQRMELSL
jgi:hypothetical protein